MGGNFNANTRESLTQYLFTVPAEDLDVALHIEATRMRGVLDTREDWDQERGAIEQEVAQDLSNPGYVLYAKLRASMFAGTPYAHDALGTRPSFDATRVEMLRQFHDTWYVPNNAILVVVGDLEPASALEKIRALFGDIPAKPVPARPVLRLAAPRAVRLQVDTDRPTGTQMLAMRVPGLNSPDFPALEVLADVLSSQRFDLYGLVPQGKAINAEFALDPLPQSGLAYAAVPSRRARIPRRSRPRVRAILAKVERDGVPAELVAGGQAAGAAPGAVREEFDRGAGLGLGRCGCAVWSELPDEDLQRIERVTRRGRQSCRTQVSGSRRMRCRR